MEQIVEVHEPFIRYIINAPHTIWWIQFFAPFLKKRNWYVIEPTEFSFESSYGFDPLLDHNLHIRGISYADYCLQKAAIVVEYHGNPPDDSVFEPSNERTIIDDLHLCLSILGVIANICGRSRDSQRGNGLHL